MKTCTIENCSSPLWARQRCKRHYGRLQMSEYRKNHPEYVAKSNEYVRQYMENVRKDNSIRLLHVNRCRQWRAKLKDDVFMAYGGWICACCGETEPVFLHLDHMNGGGCAQRKQLGRTDAYGVYSHLRKNGFPPGYQILCANCNMAKHQVGVCPHQLKNVANS